MGHSDVRHLSHLVLRQCQVQFQDVPRVKTTSTVFRTCKDILVSFNLFTRCKFRDFRGSNCSDSALGHHRFLKVHTFQRNTVLPSSKLKCVSWRIGLFYRQVAQNVGSVRSGEVIKHFVCQEDLKNSPFMRAHIDKESLYLCNFHPGW
jgi:hypothetical protein